MLALIRNQPLFLLMTGIAALAMFVPAAHASVFDRHAEARAFFYAGLLLLILTVFVAIARGATRRRDSLMHNLLALCAAFTILPLALAVPFYEALRTTSFLNAYFEMVSSLTTTGATLYAPDRLSPSLHLWRALVGWLGGLLIWVSAAAVLAPLSLGGFEVTARGQPGQSDTRAFGVVTEQHPQQRIMRVTAILTPLYAGLTLALWVMLTVVGEDGFVALCHAMAVMSTSGISPVGGLSGAATGVQGEMLLALFLLFALSRITFSGDTLGAGRSSGVWRDSEFRLGMVLVLAVPLVLFLRHWVGAIDFAEAENLAAAARAFWGALFTVLSFLTTAGFISTEWDAAQSWSGLRTPGVIFLGLVMIGGGVATTAGGVKLLRVWALYLHGLREMERMIHPSGVGQAGRSSRRLGANGAFVAWIFFMLFAASIVLFTLILAWFTGSVEHALVLALAGLSTTGPLISIAPEAPIALALMPAPVKLITAAAMVIGRLELLAVIALIANDQWRR